MASWERASANMIRQVGTILQGLGERMSNDTPISAACERFITMSFPESWDDFLSFEGLSASQSFWGGVLGSLGFVVLMTTLFRVFGSTPVLQTVPPPAARYDSDIDEQADQFVDEDVQPQLVSRGTENCIRAENPATGQALGYVAGHGIDDVAKIVERARAAQPEWAQSSFERRRRVLRVLRDYLLFEQTCLCEVSCRDTGKTMTEALLGEILPSLDKLHWLLKEGEQALKSDFRSVGPLAIHKTARVDFTPLGVIVAVAPWNYPLHNILNPVSAALFAGNSIIVKPSEHAAFSSAHYVRVIRRALAVCGERADLVQLVNGGPEVSEALVSADVDKVFFTGSTTVGRKVAVATARRLTPTVLELGGKDPLILCDDADVDHALPICMRAVFQNAGQNCIAVERVFAHRAVKQRFIERVVAQVKQIRLGVDMGAMTLGEPAVNAIQTLVDDAVAKGAVILTGGSRADVDGKGWYYAPTVLDGVTTSMRIAQEEVFGPVMSIIEWEDDKQLIRSVNDCPFGLGSNVFTANRKRGEYILSQLRAGMGNINDFASTYLCQSMPFGGTKDSGSDRFAGIEGLRGCCLMRSTTRDRFSWIKTNVPKVLQYPVRPNAAQFAAEINDLAFNPAFFHKLDNVRNIVGMLVFKNWKPRSVGSG